MKEASVGIFLHQSVNDLLGCVKATRVRRVRVPPRFLSGRRIQVDLQDTVC